MNNETESNEMENASSAAGSSLEIQSETEQKREIKIDEVFSLAFDESNGFKLSFFKAILLIILFYIPVIGLQLGIEYLGNGSFQPPQEPDAESMGFALLGQLLSTLLTTPVHAGLAIFALKRVRGEDYEAMEVFRYFNRIIPLFIAVIIMYLLLVLGFTLLILPGIYLMVAYYFATTLVVDKGMGPWQALETSRKQVTKHWFTVFLSIIAIGLINFIAMLPLGIGLIWSLPWSTLVYALLYKNLFD